MRKTIISLFILCIFIYSTCTSMVKGLSDSLYSQKDIKLVEDGAPSFLLLVESFIYSNPKNKDWLITGIQLYSAYSSAFVKDKERKTIFLDKTKDWALKLLRTYTKFKQTENGDFSQYEKWVATINDREVPYVFWAANAWIMWIIAHSDSIEAIMDLPKAKAIVDRIYKIKPDYYYGAPHLFYGIYYSALPEIAGGDLVKAKVEFDKALEISGDKFLMTKISYAEFYLKAKYDKKNYIKVLEEVANADLDKYPEVRLLNAFSKKQAKELLDQIGKFFYNDDFR